MAQRLEGAGLLPSADAIAGVADAGADDSAMALLRAVHISRSYATFAPTRVARSGRLSATAYLVIDALFVRATSGLSHPDPAD